MRFGPILAVAFLAFSCVAASADSTISGNGGFTGSADLTTDNGNNGVYTILAITGTGGYGLGVTGLISAGQFNNGLGQTNDNLLYPDSTAVVDTNGFAFTDTEGDTNFKVDIYSTASGDFAYLLDNDGFAQTIPVTLDVTLVQQDPVFSISFQGIPAATPEPSSLALLGTGSLALAGLIRRRRRCHC